MMSTELTGHRNGAFHEYLEALVQDPIYDERMTDPRIDPCGHTFDSTTIDALVKKWTDDARNSGTEKGFVCPFTYNWVKSSELYPNLKVKEIAGSVDALEIAHQELSNAGTKQALEVQASEIHRSISIAVNEATSEYKSLVLSLQKKYDDVIATQVHQSREITSQNREIVALKGQCVVLDQRVQAQQLEIKEKGKEINQQAEQIAEQEKTVIEKNNVIEGLQNRIAERDNSLFWTRISSAFALVGVVGSAALLRLK